MLKGIDISKYQYDNHIDLNKIKFDFAIVKATEGIGYVDRACDRFVQQLISMGKPWGFYHFARTENNPIAEAKNFVKNTKNYFHRGIVALDYEPSNAKQSDVHWCSQWLQTVIDETGVIPLLYTYEGLENRFDWSEVVNMNVGLWIAKYPSKSTIVYNYDNSVCSKPKLRNWKSCAMWQFAGDNGRLDGYSHGIDCDVFYGDVSAWNAYAGKDKGTVETAINDGLICVEQSNDSYMTVLGFDERKNMMAFDGVGIEALINCNYFNGNTTLGVAQGDDVSKVPHQKEFCVLYQLNNGDVGSCLASDYWYNDSDVDFAFSPYCVTMLNNNHYNDFRPLFKSIACGNKDHTPTQTTAVFKVQGKWNFVVGKSETPSTISRKLFNRGADTIAILDGGGSTGMIVNHVWKFKTDRPIVSCLAFIKCVDDNVKVPIEDLQENEKDYKQMYAEEVAKNDELNERITNALKILGGE